MRKILIYLLCLVFIGCRSHETDGDAVLSQPPFNALSDSIAKAPGNAGLYYRRGVLLYQNNQVSYAEEDIRKAWQLAPEEEYALSLATLLKKKSADSAIVFLQEALKKLPGSIALQIGLARGYQSRGETAKAAAIADEILNQHPGQLDALTLKSEILSEQNNKSGALAYLEKAYAIMPSDPSLAYDLAYEYAEAKNARALTITDSIIRAATPEFEKAYYIKGVYLANIGKGAEAIKNFDEAIRINYNFLDAYRDKGQLLLEQKKYGQALKTFELALKIAPASAEFYYLVGKAQQALGNTQEAKLNYERAYGLDKSMTEAKEAAEKL
jgi:tetratricopeptide (TPR) repeat protein